MPICEINDDLALSFGPGVDWNVIPNPHTPGSRIRKHRFSAEITLTARRVHHINAKHLDKIVRLNNEDVAVEKLPSDALAVLLVEEIEFRNEVDDRTADIQIRDGRGIMVKTQVKNGTILRVGDLLPVRLCFYCNLKGIPPFPTMFNLMAAELWFIAKICGTAARYSDVAGEPIEQEPQPITVITPGPAETTTEPAPPENKE